MLVGFFAVNDAKGKQKVLGSNKKLKFNPMELILYCKDFRIVRFRFDEAGPESAKKVLSRFYFLIIATVVILMVHIIEKVNAVYIMI